MLLPCQNRSRKLSYDRPIYSSLTRLKRGLAYNFIAKFRQKNKSSTDDHHQMDLKINNQAMEKAHQETLVHEKENVPQTDNKLMVFPVKPPSKIIFVNELQLIKETRAASLNQNKLKITLTLQSLEKSGQDQIENRSQRVPKRIKSSKNRRFGSKVRQKTAHDIEKELDSVRFENLFVSSALNSQRSRETKIHKASNSIPECAFEKQIRKMNIFGLKAMENDLVDHFRLKTAVQKTRIKSKKINCLFMEDNSGTSKFL